VPLDRILIVDDEPIIAKLIEEICTLANLGFAYAPDLATANGLILRETYDLVFLDVRLPDGDGHQFLERLMTLPDRPIVVLVTGAGTIESAVACMRAGAFDYVVKPFSASRIQVLLKKADAYNQLVKVNRYLNDRGAGDEEFVVAGSLAMRRLRAHVGRVAPTEATVLITGEHGSGKEMVAREIFRLSSRRREPFIKVNCAALSETLIESELFGHERGAFTGATEKREGRFELANRGTLLLDEVSEIPPRLQAKLLRVLQEREFERVGGSKPIKVNVRILATSNRELLRYVEQGSFRADLYYRLNVFPIHVPPLRERREEIPLLAESFLRLSARRSGIRILGFSPQAMHALHSYHWPGNVRELQNTIERAVILSENDRPISGAALGIELPAGAVEDVVESDWQPPVPLETVPGAELLPPRVAPAPPPSAAAAPGSAPVLQSLAEMEKYAILAAMKAKDGNRVQVVELLGISIRTLRNKLQEYRESGDFSDE
jgi:two-component system response regulator AtoC